MKKRDRYSGDPKKGAKGSSLNWLKVNFVNEWKEESYYFDTFHSENHHLKWNSKRMRANSTEYFDKKVLAAKKTQPKHW